MTITHSRIAFARRLRRQGWPWRGIAHHLGCDVATIRKAVYAARERERRPEINAQRRERKYRAWLRAEETKLLTP